MRHRNTKSILNRPASQRKALVRSLLTSLFLHGSIKTTQAKAKVLAQEAEKLISKVKSQKEKMNAIRNLKQVIYTQNASVKALEYATNTSKTSGFTRIVKLSTRAGDNAPTAQVELIIE